VRDAGGAHLVFVSVAAADRPTGVPVFDSKHAVEQHIRRVGVPYTIIAPVYTWTTCETRGTAQRCATVGSPAP
jgi:uncharacterized protein YbjT (DUF2867 family)